VKTVEAAAAALDAIASDYARHAAAARDLAMALLAAPVVLGQMAADLGL